MTKKKGSTQVAVNQRQQKVCRYWIRGLGPEEIAATLRVNPTTIYRDLEKLKQRLARQVQVSDLYSLQRAFDELDEQNREMWGLYHKKLPVKEGDESEDDRLVRALIMDRIHRVTLTRCRLSGFFSAKVMERITMLETQTGRGIRIERLTFEEQLQRGVEELENNEGLARSEGLNKPD